MYTIAVGLLTGRNLYIDFWNMIFKMYEEIIHSIRIELSQRRRGLASSTPMLA